MTDLALFDRLARSLGEPELERALEEALALLAGALRLDAAWIWLLDEPSDRFYLGASYDLPPYLREPVHMTGQPCWCMEAFHDGALESQNVDVMTCSRLREGIATAGAGVTRGLRAHASVAFAFAERRLGILNAARSSEPRFDSDELKLLATVAAQLGVAVDRARLAERAADAARAEERARLAREIHDTLAQDLTAVTLQLESAQRKLEDNDARARVEAALDLTRRSVSQIRSSVEGLRADPLDGKPLPNALASLARRFTSETGVRVALRRPSSELLLAPHIEHELYRVATEAIANVRRHADARHVELALERTADGMILRIEDDGRGFDLSQAKTGFGLRIMRERAQAIGGELRLRSRPDHGTTIEAHVPLPQ